MSYFVHGPLRGPADDRPKSGGGVRPGRPVPEVIAKREESVGRALSDMPTRNLDPISGRPLPEVIAARGRQQEARAPAEELSAVSRALNGLMDKLTAQFAACVELFRTSGLTVPGSVYLVDADPDEDGDKRSWHLAYGKREGTWGLYLEMHRESIGHDGQNYTTIVQSLPVVRGSREHRILAAKAIPKLHAEIRESLGQQLEEAQNAVSELEAFLGSTPLPGNVEREPFDDPPPLRRPSFTGKDANDDDIPF